GFNTSSTNNVGVVAGAGSLWTNSLEFYVGYNGSGNRLVVTNGAGVWSQNGYVGGELGSNNLAIITGPGSGSDPPEVINNFVTVGGAGIGNRLEVRNGGSVRSWGATIGLASESGANDVLVTDPGSVWTNSDPFYVGFDGNRSRLVVSNAGLVATG